MRDYYEILGVTRTADDAGLKAAFRKLAMEHHPDRNGGCEDASGRFKEINEAYSVLSDPQKRAAYDRFGHAGVNGGQGGGGFSGDPSDIFSDVFGDVFGEMFGGGRRPSNGPQRGQDLRYDLEISLEQAYAGAEVEIKVPAAITCEVCDGSGAKVGTSPTVCGTCGGHGRVRATQGFFAVERGCPRCGGSGRLVLDPCQSCNGHGQVRRERVLSVIPHELFERDGLDLLCTVPVPMTVAALGGEIDAPCLMGGEECDGTCKIPVKVPEGAQTGKTVRLKGKGMPSLRSRQRGDLVVELFVETPTHLSARQKELLKELAGLCGEKQNPKSANFVGKAKRFWDEVTGS
ncbi:MAG: molecular chaperone DnaJ [Caulobacter sp. 12-67-6]|nr:MAG: molecular chaperone DnaJ [Caulobacter sp. 12-67-6]